MDTFFKLRHIPSGLFYKPSKHGSKSNLSKDGKVYQKKPPKVGFDGTWAPNPDRKPGEYGKPECVLVPCRREDWEIVEFRTVIHSVTPA